MRRRQTEMSSSQPLARPPARVLGQYAKRLIDLGSCQLWEACGQFHYIHVRREFQEIHVLMYGQPVKCDKGQQAIKAAM